ncbi:hypothetical protein [Agrococcus versicolor]|uniref:hypothetical protein n=1 Tax=Agrococcus versicolor TaxID=501482 RepID=UPI0031DB7AA6
MLPTTGADGGAWVAVAAVAAVALVLGGLLLRRGVSRRAVGTGIAALALVGVLALGSGGAASSAFADAGTSADCVSAGQAVAPSAAPTAAPTTASTVAPTTPPSVEPTTPPTDEPATVVTPLAPTAATQCGAEPLVAIPTQEGVSYAQTRDGDVLTLTASALPGFVVASGAQTVFTVDVAATERAEPPVAVPAQVATVPQSEQEGVLTLGAVDPTLIPAVAEAAAAGSLEYELSTTDRLTYGYSVLDGTGATIATGTVSAPFPTTVTYADGAYALSYANADVSAVFAEVERQLDAVEAQYPGAMVQSTRTPTDLGIRLTTSYEPGPGCETSITESTIVVIDQIAPRRDAVAPTQGGLLLAPSDSLR